MSEKKLFTFYKICVSNRFLLSCNFNRTYGPTSHNWNYYPGAQSSLQLISWSGSHGCISGWPMFKWMAKMWYNARVLRQQTQQFPMECPLGPCTCNEAILGTMSGDRAVVLLYKALIYLLMGWPSMYGVMVDQQSGLTQGWGQDINPAGAGPWFNIKMPSCQYRKSHSGDKMTWPW